MKRCWIATFIALWWLAGCGGGSSIPSNPTSSNVIIGTPSQEAGPDGNGGELPEPPVVDSVNGVARVSLQVNVGATGFPAFYYKGVAHNAPTIRVNPGDTIVLDVTDDLPPIRGDRNDINIHFHGLGSSPRAPGDDVLGMLARPGQKLHYAVHVPKNQEPGLYWYHPHVHGETSYQVGQAGMSGAIVVNGLEKHIPALARMKQRVIIVRAVGTGGGAPPDDGGMGMSGDGMPMPGARPQVVNSQPCGPDLGLVTTLNNVYHPVITIAPGEKQFFRVVNATGHKTLKLWDGGDLKIVAIDGFALDTWPGTPATETVKSLVMPPASRAEFVVTGPHNGYATFRTLCYDTGVAGDHDPDLKLGTMIAPRHQHAATAPDEPLRVGAPLPQNYYTTQLPPVAAKRYVVFSEGAKRFFINGKAFSMSDPPTFVVHVGTVEEWRIVNVTQEIHDFHLHQAHFLVKQINGVKLAHPYWADSVVIPH